MDGVMGKAVYAFGDMTGVGKTKKAGKTKNGAIKYLLKLNDDHPGVFGAPGNCKYGFGTCSDKGKGSKDKDSRGWDLGLASLGPLKTIKNKHWPDGSKWNKDEWNKDEYHKMSVVPVPAAFWLFGTALIGFIGMSRRTKV